MGFFDSLFSNSSGAPNSGAPDFSRLNDNVFFNQSNTPRFLANRPRLTRGLDNALLSAATFQSAGPTASAGENISAVGRNLLGLDSNRTSMNMQRQLAPYMAMHPLLQMQGEMDKQSLEGAQAEEARAHAAYFLGAGRELGQPKDYTDAQGNEWQIPNNGPARPVMGQPSALTTTPDLQIGDTRIPGNTSRVNGPMQQLKGRIPGLTNGTETERLFAQMDQERVAQGGQPMNAAEKYQKLMELTSGRASAQASGHDAGTPGFVSEARKIEINSQLGDIKKQMDQLENSVPGMITSVHPDRPHPKYTQQRDVLMKQQQSLLDELNGRGAAKGDSSLKGGSSLSDIPQLVAPVTTGGPNVMIGNTPGTLGGGATIGDLQNAMVPPGPKASRPAKPAPARSSRPKVSIDAKGNVSIG